MRRQADVPVPPPEEQQQLMQFIQKQAKLLEQARAIEAQQRAAAAKVWIPSLVIENVQGTHAARVPPLQQPALAREEDMWRTPRSCSLAERGYRGRHAMHRLQEQQPAQPEMVEIDQWIVDFAHLFRDTTGLDFDRHVELHNLGFDKIQVQGACKCKCAELAGKSLEVLASPEACLASLRCQQHVVIRV